MLNYTLLNHKEAVGPQVYRILREQIIRGEVPPGTRFSESEISKNFNISRQPVREAFLKLKSEGLLQIRPQRGSFVTKIRIDAVNDARFIREAIEADIAKFLAANKTPETIKKLREQIKLQRKVAASSTENFIEYDEQFHHLLAECAEKAIAWKVISNMKAHLDRVRYISNTEKPVAGLIDQHEAIVEAIAKGDVDLADKEIRNHMQEVLRDLPDILKKHPEFFSEVNEQVGINATPEGM